MTTEGRLEKIERTLAAVKNRNKRLWLGLILFGAGILITGAIITEGDVISARAFRVVDEKGNLRAVLGVVEGGSMLRLYDEEGKTRAGLSVIEGEPMLDLYDEEGNPRALLSVTEGKPRAGLGSASTRTPDGKTVTYPESSLLLFGPDGKLMWSAP